MALSKDYLCVVAIDIGTSHSCCAYSFKDRSADIFFINWNDYNVAQPKVPTTVLFDQNKQFHSFGFEAIEHFNKLRNEEEKKRWYLFEDGHRMTKDYMFTENLPDKNGKQLETYKVYGSIIRAIIDRMCTLLNEKRTGLDERDLHIVITVPLILTKSYKTMLEKAVLYAGLTDRYCFVQETESILSYWEYIWCEERGHIENLDLNNQHGFLLVNLKGTATITAIKVRDGIIARLHNITGGGWGGQAVNEEFKQFLIKIVGAPVFLKFVDEEETEWVKLESAFEIKKQAAKSEDIGKVTIRLPVQLHKMYEEYCNESVHAAVQSSPYSKNISFIGDKIRLDASLFKRLFTNTIKEITSNIKEVLQNEVTKEIKTIVMVGGFSNSPIVQDAVKQAFPECYTFVPNDPGFTLIRGAVLKGHYGIKNPKKIPIVSKFTYGVRVCHINNEHECSEVEREETKVFIRKGDTIYEGDKVTWKFTLEACDLEHMEIQFFKSPKNESLSVDEKDVEYLQQVRIDFIDGLYTKDVRIDIIYEHCSNRGSRFVGKVQAPGILFVKALRHQ